MATAKPLHVVGGVYPTPATLYEVDPPISGSSYVVVFYAPPVHSGIPGQIVVVRATQNGGPLTRQVDPIDGTHHTSNPDEGHARAFRFAGETLGVGPYEIVAPDLTPDPAAILAEAETDSADGDPEVSES